MRSWVRGVASTFDVSVFQWVIGHRLPVLNLLFHSSEAIVGGSPYNRTEAELAAFCDRLERFFEYARQSLGAVPVTFAEFEKTGVEKFLSALGIAAGIRADIPIFRLDECLDFRINIATADRGSD